MIAQLVCKYGSREAICETREKLGIVAELWGVDAAKLEASLLRRHIFAGRDVIEKRLNVAQVQSSCKAMCMTIYERCFLWIVKKLKSVLSADCEANFIGVLDAPGFEVLQDNSLEQLCINYTDEKLQDLYNCHMFKLEQEEYAKEEIVWTYIDFGLDCKQTVDLIEKRPNSILSFLDEESIFPRATDETLIQKQHTLATKNPKYSKVQFKKLNFQIQHYAGDVIYDVTDWITKNKDPLQDDIVKCLRSSRYDFLQMLFDDPDLTNRYHPAPPKTTAAGVRPTGQRPSTGGGSFITVTGAFRDLLHNLMATLGSTRPRFIRCIVPNLRKEPNNLQREYVLKQLACNGVLEGIRISRHGFCDHMLYDAFVQRYSLLLHRRPGMELKDASIAILVEARLRTGEHPLYQFGMTKVFMRHGVLAWLEQLRGQKLSEIMVAIQSGARSWIARFLARCKLHQPAAAATLQKNMKAYAYRKGSAWWQMFVACKRLLLEQWQVDRAALLREVDSLRRERDDLQQRLDAALALLHSKDRSEPE